MSEEDDCREYERECAREDEHWLDEQIETAVGAERDRCAQICADIAGDVDWHARGILQMDAEQVGIECASRIRGEK